MSDSFDLDSLYKDGFNLHRLYVPILPSLKQYTNEHGMTLGFVGDEDPWTGAHCQMGWLNSEGQTCFLYVIWSQDEQYKFSAVRWGANRLIGRRSWDLDFRDGPEALKAILDQAHQWVEAPADQA